MSSDLVWSRAQVIRGLRSGRVAGIAATGLTIRFVLTDGLHSGYLASSVGSIRRFQTDSAAWRVVDNIKSSASPARS